jgi:membrane associated rhomboid family serine protease
VAVTSDHDFFWSDLENSDLIFLSIYIIVALMPFINSYRQKTSVALAMILSLLLVMFVRFSLDLANIRFNEIELLAMIPIISSEPDQMYRFVTAAWLHADWLHVLSNILVIGLVGVPLEQRLGSKRWMIVYALGFIGGNIAWVMTHPESHNPAIGASGAVFGLLGAYMACWPNDEVEFPLLFLIRAWPIWVIVFVRLGLEIYQMYSIQEGTAGETNIAHMAHIGGFILAYLLARIIARGSPSSLSTEDSNPTSASHNESMRIMAKKSMGDLTNDPWELANKPLKGNAGRILNQLKLQGDELETRQAWLEELAENTICPICDGEIKIDEKAEVHRLVCAISGDHLFWP